MSEQEVKFKDARTANINAAIMVADEIKTTLGPKGFDKMLFDPKSGDLDITNDGVTIIERMQVSHPAAKMLVDVARTQAKEVGDGTTTAIVLTGELLKQAQYLLERGIPSSTLIHGYETAREEALVALENEGIVVDRDLLKRVAITSMTGKNSESQAESLAEMCLSAVEATGFDLDHIKRVKKVGGSVRGTSEFHGVVLNKEPVNYHMASELSNPKVLLLDQTIGVREPEVEAKIQLNDHTQLQKFVEEEERIIRDLCDKIKATGSDVVFCQRSVDEVAGYLLARYGVLAIKRVSKEQMEALARLTGAKIVSDIEHFDSTHLGMADSLKFEDSEFFVEKRNGNVRTLIIHGSTKQVCDEIDRALEDALMAVCSANEVGKVVSGGGSIEMEIARHLRKVSESHGGKTQLVLQGFAEALEAIPAQLAKSAGMDTIDSIADLRKLHNEGGRHHGVHVHDSIYGNMKEHGVIEPLKTKRQAINSATEYAVNILRIDNILLWEKR